MYKRILFRAIPLIALASVGGWLARSAVVAQVPDSPAQLPSAQSSANLLVNGSMEGDYYWRYPNHFIAPGWIRWWIHGSVLPEYDLTRGPRSHVYYDGERAQVYFKWGPSYTAGLYQVVTTGVTPCVPYRLTAWARNHSLEGVLPHARIGLDPQGTQLTSNDYEGAVISLPPLTAWSQEQTNLSVWEQLSVEAEPLGNRLTAILYASPWRPDDGRTYYFDTFWDAASLTQVEFPNNRLPAPGSWTPSGFITNVITTSVSGGVMVQWDTLGPASTQVWYDIITPPAPVVTPTGAFTIYLPLVSKSPYYAFATPLDTTPTMTHQATIPLSDDLPSGTRVEFVLLSRRPLASACVTEVYGPLVITIE